MTRRASISATVLAASLTTTFAHAQDVAPVPSTVEAAEAEGAKHPRALQGTEQSMYAEAFGPTDRRCVDADVGTHRTARSGEFVAGPFNPRVLMGNPRGPQGARRKVWWTPRQGTAMPALQLRAAKIDAPTVTVNWTLPSVARANHEDFYNTLFLFPEMGKWLVVVTAGNNWGCFLMDEIDPRSLVSQTQPN